MMRSDDCKDRRTKVASRIDFICDEQQKTEEIIGLMEKEHVELQESHIRNIKEI